MSVKTRSARGEIVDFDLLAIKQQLATAPVPVSVADRRRFIDEKDGVKTRSEPVSALSIAQEGVEESQAAADSIKEKTRIKDGTKTSK